MSSLPRVSLPVERHTLDNGLKVVLHQDRSLPLVAVNLWYHVGSKNELPGRTGFAHLFEHMLFQGSQHVGTNDHFKHIQQVGGVANGSTAYDRTNYYETLPANCLDLGLWLESDRMGFLLPAMTSDKLENQREVVMNERRQRVDNQPYGRAFERLQELIYPSPHPYHWPVIGYMEDIEAATLEDIEAFFGRYYIPNNAVLTLAGDFEHAEALKRVEHYFGDIESGATVEPVRAELPPIAGEIREVLEDDVELARIYLGFQAPAITDDRWYAGDLLAAALTGGKSSPLYQDLAYQKQLVQDVGAVVLSTEIATTFAIVATVRPGVEVDRVIEEIDAHLARAALEPPATDDLERARNRFLTGYFEQLQSVDNRADLFSKLTTYYDAPERIETEADRYAGIVPSDLTAFAHDFLRKTQRVRLDVVPRGAASS